LNLLIAESKRAGRVNADGSIDIPVVVNVLYEQQQNVSDAKLSRTN
jgi:hypothetical protein